jgi:hypothetical protein
MLLSPDFTSFFDRSAAVRSADFKTGANVNDFASPLQGKRLDFTAFSVKP